MSKSADRNNIEMSGPVKQQTRAPSRLKRFLTDSSLGHRQSGPSDDSYTTPKVYHKVTVFLPVMDRLIQEMERRFGNKSTVVTKEHCYQDSNNFLDAAVLQPLLDSYNLDKSGSLLSSTDVLKLLASHQSAKPKDTVELMSMLKPAGGFPDLRRLLQLAVTVPVVSVTAERCCQVCGGFALTSSAQ